jgi:hypothetical protein
MYIDSCKTGKYSRHLLRENYREKGKIKHRTIANLSSCSEDDIEDRLYRRNPTQGLFLYDVTSSYLEGFPAEVLQHPTHHS